MAGAARLARMAEYEDAEALLEQCIPVAEKTYAKDGRLQTVLNNLAMLYQTCGFFEKAELLLKRSLELREKAARPDELQVAQAVHNLASLYQVEKRYDEAERLYQRALKMREAVLRESHPDIAITVENLALVYFKQQKLAEAETMLKRAMAMRDKWFAPDHPARASAYGNLGELYASQKEYEQAEQAFKTALGIVEKAMGESQPDVAHVLVALAGCYREQGKLEQARPLLARAGDHEQDVGQGAPELRGVPRGDGGTRHGRQGPGRGGRPLCRGAANCRAAVFAAAAGHAAHPQGISGGPSRAEKRGSGAEHRGAIEGRDDKAVGDR